MQVTAAGPAGAQLPPGKGGGGDPCAGPSACAGADAGTLRPDSAARTETAPLSRTPEFSNRTFVLRLPTPLGAALHARAVLQLTLYSTPSLDAPPGPLLAGKESDDLAGRGYIEIKGELAARLLRGGRATLPVALLDLSRDAAAAVAGTGAMRVCAPKGSAAGGISGATAQLLAERSSVVAGNAYGKTDLEVLVDLTLLDCAAVDWVPLGLPQAAAAGPPGGGGGATAAGAGGGQQAGRALPRVQSAGRALPRAPSAGGRDAEECSLLVLVSAAEALPDGGDSSGGGGGGVAGPFVALMSQRDSDQRLPAQATTRAAAASSDPAWCARAKPRSVRALRGPRAYPLAGQQVALPPGSVTWRCTRTLGPAPAPNPDHHGIGLHTRRASMRHPTRRGELLRVTYQEERLPDEKLLLAVVDGATGRLVLRAAVPLAAVVPGGRRGGSAARFR